jgi:hypothetical protein
MPRSSHPSGLEYSNYTWRRVQVMKFLKCITIDYIKKTRKYSSGNRISMYRLESTNSYNTYAKGS